MYKSKFYWYSIKRQKNNTPGSMLYLFVKKLIYNILNYSKILLKKFQALRIGDENNKND